MNNKRISSLENYESFKAVCSFFRLEDEYPGWTGYEKFGIITDQAEPVLLSDYPAIMQALSPYIILGKEYASVRNESMNNDRRHQRNQENSESLFAFDEETEYHHAELVCSDFTEELIRSELLENAMSCLTEIQRRRVEQYYFQDMNLKAICESEGGNVKPVSVWESIQAALKKMKKYF